jgi:hypothetical protein
MGPHKAGLSVLFYREHIQGAIEFKDPLIIAEEIFADIGVRRRRSGDARRSIDRDFGRQ